MNVEDIFEESAIKQGRLPSRRWLADNFKSKSAMIRYLYSHDFDIKAIAEVVNVRYQHAYNVIEKFKKQPSDDKCCPVCRRNL